jgi:hypothetical protein
MLHIGSAQLLVLFDAAGRRVPPTKAQEIISHSTWHLTANVYGHVSSAASCTVAGARRALPFRPRITDREERTRAGASFSLSGHLAVELAA